NAEEDEPAPVAVGVSHTEGRFAQRAEEDCSGGGSHGGSEGDASGFPRSQVVLGNGLGGRSCTSSGLPASVAGQRSCRGKCVPKYNLGNEGTRTLILCFSLFSSARNFPYFAPASSLSR